jgi:hypothetical protein
MHHSRLFAVIIDCQADSLESGSRFWAGALGRDALAPDPGGGYVPLAHRDGEPHIELQRVTHPSRVHIDIESDDVEAEVRRLEALGARRVTQVRHWWVMEAPTGQRFCVVRTKKSSLEGRANRWD